MTCSQLAAAAWVVAALACGGADGEPAPGPPQRVRTTVRFEYVAATSTDPAVAAGLPECVRGVGQTHIHPSWRGYERIEMRNATDRWTIAFEDVPAGSRERIRVSDPNACAENPTGAATRDVFANGVHLTEIVDTPGSGVEPGLAFSVAPDGSVTP